jgi:hypothetical protein
MEYCATTQANSILVELEIRKIMNMPIIGVNAKTRKLEYNKQKTEC